MCEGNDWLWLVLWLVAVHLVGLFYARRRRLDLLAHLHHLSQAATSSAAIVSDAAACKQLLSNIFPPQVLRQIEEQEQRLLQYDGEGGEGGGEGGGGGGPERSIAQLHTGCSFLFAKVVGLAELVGVNSVSSHPLLWIGGRAGGARWRPLAAAPHDPAAPPVHL